MIQIRRRTAVLATVAFIISTAIGATALVRTAGAGGNTFSDTPPWIAAHANWLEANGIANGYADGSFRPNDDITRGQSAFWLGNYNDALEVVRSEVDPGPSNNFSLEVPCPLGKRAIAGGGFVQLAPPTAVFMTRSYSFLSNTTGLSTWVVDFESEDDTSVDPPRIEVQALCAPDTINSP